MEMEIGIFFGSNDILTGRGDLKIDGGRIDKKVEMEHDWTMVTMKRRTPTKSDSITIIKVDPIDEVILPIKRTNPESIQALIRTRLDRAITQEKADQVCMFPRNTIKEIESHKTLPTAAQQQTIQKQFGVLLNIISKDVA